MEVRVLRRLPAHAAQLRGRADPVGGTGRDRLLPGGDAGRGRGSLRRLARRGLDHHAPGRRGADPPDPGGLEAVWSRSGPARPPAASRRCATSPTSPSSGRSSTPPRVPLHPRPLHGDRRARARRLRAARVPGRPPPAPRGAGRRVSRGADRGSPRTACASSASSAATSASRWPTAPRAWGRSRRPAVARCARRTTAAATAASDRRTARTPPRWRDRLSGQRSGRARGAAHLPNLQRGLRGVPPRERAARGGSRSPA